MKNFSAHWIKYNLTFLFLLILIKNSKLDSNEDSKILKAVKRDLLRREREYLKTQPLSEGLKDFIKRYKRKAQFSKIKRKVSDDNPDNPNEKDTDQLTKTSASTVVTSSNPTSTVEQNATSPLSDDDSVTPSTLTGTVTLSGDTSTNQTSSFATCNEMVTEFDEYDIAPTETTTHKRELLGKVMKDVQELIRYENAAKTSEGEASLCNVTGDWDSFAGGKQIRIFGRYTPQFPIVRIVGLEPPMNGFLAESGWNATAIVPFPHSSLLVITAVSTKGRKIATFLGECRICEGSESITGHWMIRRRSKNCKDREEANTFVSDVLRKNNVRKLHKDHINQVTTTTENLDNQLAV